jgi:hypothetical protein
MAEEMCSADDSFGLAELYAQVNGGPGMSVVESAVTSIAGSPPSSPAPSNGSTPRCEEPVPPGRAGRRPGPPGP